MSHRIRCEAAKEWTLNCSGLVESFLGEVEGSVGFLQARFYNCFKHQGFLYCLDRCASFSGLVNRWLSCIDWLAYEHAFIGQRDFGGR
ncbi:MAG: hypothetical protein ACI92G_004647 [Candidatus Pelagisphaera sp.]|jgi:hypothetical protein